jgi:hemolysin III
MQHDRLTLGRMTNPVRGFLHGSAALASAAGLVVLVVRTASDLPRLTSMLVFGLSLIGLYTTSALYHSVPWPPRWKVRLQRLDHTMILFLVAGTYTPLAVNVLSGRWRVVTLGVVWGLALLGMAQKIAFPRVRAWFTLVLALGMGWFAVVPLAELADRLAFPALLLIALGGLAYMIGAVVYASRRPRLFPRIFSHHELFHVFVVIGSAFHFVMVFLYVVPIPRI